MNKSSSIEKPVDRAGQKPVDRPVNRRKFEFTGRVEKILTGSISELDTRIGKARAVMRTLHYSVVMKR